MSENTTGTASRAARREQRKQKQRRRRLLVGIAILVIVVLGVLLVLRGRAEQRASALAGAGSQTYVVRSISNRDTVDVAGNIEAVRARNHAFPTSGEVVEILVAEGQRVREGELLARLDDTQERYNLANLDLTIEEQELADNTRQLEVLRLQREILVAALEDTELRAEFAGTVVSIPVDPGDLVGAGATIARIIDTSAMVANVELSEFDVELVEVGMPVEFVFEALPDQVFMGIVSDLSLEGQVSNSGLAQIPAELRIDAGDPRIRPAYSFLAEIIISDAQEVLAVESAAILERAGRTLAIRANAPEGEQRLVPVQVEELEGGLVRVLSGLEEGDELLDAASLAEAAQNREETGGTFQFPGAPGALPPGAGRALRAPAGGGAR